ncbi:LamG-like jellyroll fold domain-containing protein [Pedosphaera parvula]|nr:LamG-like jellyroll fold domain-containing protein [Pedosphaera parvula]
MKSTMSARWKKQWVPFAAALALSGVRVASAADYPTTILGDHPMAYYRLEETSSTAAVDSSASGAFPGVYNVSGSNPLLGQPGIDTNSIALSVAQPSSVTAGYYDEMNQQAPFSFEIWANPISTDLANYRCPIGNFSGWNTSTQSGWYVYQIAGSPTAFACITASGVWIQSAAVTLFNWYHIVGVYDGTNMSFYLNGTLVGTQSAAGYTANSVNNAGVNPIALGFRGDGSGYGAFDGNLDEFAYYTNALTAAQVLAHYQVGTNSFRVAAAPALLKDTASATNYAGSSAQFSVIASGATPLAYQWYKGGVGGARINGATNSTLSFTAAPVDDGTTYQVIVTNYVGSVTSSVATLTVLTNLQIDAPLTSILRNVGSAAAFEIVAEGAGPITYQWHNGDGSSIPGATNPVLWLPKVQLTNDGASYYVSVMNPYTSVDSDPATLNVQARPVDVPVNGYAKVVLADGPVAFWQLNESTGSGTAVDTVGSFDGSYVASTGGFNFGVPTGVPHDTNVAVGITGGATVNIPYAIEINPPGAFSVEGWFQPASLAANGNDYRTPLSSMSNPYGAGPTGWLVYQTGGNNWAWWPYNGFWTGAQLTDTDPIVAGQWYYLVMTYDGATFTFYVNGVAKASGTDSGFVQNGNVPAGGAASYNHNYNTNPGLPSGSSPTVLGWRSDAGFNPFVGNMDDVAVYNKVLTPSQIQSHFLNTTHLSITISGTKVVVSWPVGTLQSSSNVGGPYSNVIGATSPYTNSISGTKFFRVQVQ